METTNRGGRWLVSGVLGLAVLGTAGCAGGAGPSSQQAGPAVVLNAPADTGLSKPPSGKSAAVKGAGTGSASPSATPDADRTTKQVPPAKPKSVNDSPDTGNTPKSPPSARTP